MQRFARFSALVFVILCVGACQSMFARSHTIVYDCAGVRMMVAFNAEDRTASVSVPGEPLYVLAERPAASGFYYSNGSQRLRGERHEVRWEGAGAGVQTCYARA